MRISININKVINLYTLIALFIICFIEEESAGAFPIRVFYIQYNKSLLLLIISIAALITLGLMSRLKAFKINSVLFFLIAKTVLDILPVFQGKIVPDATFWYHYSMVPFMPIIYVIYSNYYGKIQIILRLLIVFCIIIVFQEVLTAIFNGFSFESNEFKNFLRIPMAHSNIIAVFLLAILILYIKNHTIKIESLIIISILLFGILLTKSRGAILFLLGWICVMMYQKKYEHISVNAIFFLISLALIFSLIIIFSPDVQMILFETSISDPYFWSKATSGRTDLFLLALMQIIMNPWLGSGIGVTEYNIGYEVVNTGVHNIVLDYIVQSGIIGLLLYSIAIYNVFLNKSDLNNNKINKAINLSVIVILAYSMMEVCYFNYSCIFLFWMLCGLYNRFNHLDKCLNDGNN